MIVCMGWLQDCRVRACKNGDIHMFSQLGGAVFEVLPSRNLDGRSDAPSMMTMLNGGILLLS